MCLSVLQPDLAANEAKLMQKIQLLCVMEVGSLLSPTAELMLSLPLSN